MAALLVEGDELVVRLTKVEKVEAMHGDVRVPLRCITSVEVLDRPIHAVHGRRVGTGVPGVVLVGTVTSGDAKVFAALHHNTPGGVRVNLEGAPFTQLVVGCDDPEAVAAAVRQPR
jgi:hypothetical protein